MREITSQALEYRNLGFSVIPIGSITIDPKTKKKIISYPVSWLPYTKRLASEEEIIDWFDVRAYPAIGIVTGKISSLFVLDIDSYKPGYDKALVKSFNLPPTPCQKTARGGRQYFFKYDGDARNATGVFKKDSGLDIRANGGMVIVPPSAPDYGSYEWEISPSEELFAPLPPSLEKLFEKRERKSLHEQVGLSEGTRDDSIASIVGRLAYALEPREWDREIFPTNQAINSTYKPPLSKQDLLRIYRSITAKEAERRNIKLEKESKEAETFAPSV